MININISNTIGASSSIKNESISTDTSSIWSDFINEFKLGLENNGDISNKTEGVDEDLILYNFIYTLYQNLNKQEYIVNSDQLKSIKNIMDSNITVNDDLGLQTNNRLLDSNDIKNIIDYMNNNIDKYKNILDKEELNSQLNLLLDKVKERLEAYDRLNNVSNSKNLDSIGAFNMSKIDDYNNSKTENKDIGRLESILSSDNNYTNSIGVFNKFNNIYNANTYIEQPVSEIRQDFISDDIVKAVKYIKSNDMESLNVKFNPRDLGEISINISKNNEESSLLITVDNDNVFDMVNDNIQDIKNHLKDINIDVKDVVISVKSNDENLFSDNFNRGFNQERNFKQGKNNNYTKNNEDLIDDITINETNHDDNLNILI